MKREKVGRRTAETAQATVRIPSASDGGALKARQEGSLISPGSPPHARGIPSRPLLPEFSAAQSSARWAERPALKGRPGHGCPVPEPRGWATPCPRQNHEVQEDPTGPRPWAPPRLRKEGRLLPSLTNVPPRPRRRTGQLPEAHIPCSHSGKHSVGCTRLLDRQWGKWQKPTVSKTHLPASPPLGLTQGLTRAPRLPPSQAQAVPGLKGRTGLAKAEQQAWDQSGPQVPRVPPLPAKQTQPRPGPGPQKAGQRLCADQPRARRGSARRGSSKAGGTGGRRRTLHMRGHMWAGLGGDGETERESAAKGMAEAKSRGRGGLRPQMANTRALPPGAALGPHSRPGAEQSPCPEWPGLSTGA